MTETEPLLPTAPGKPIPPVLYTLISNGLQLYGILVLGWHFFPILYLWWWEELIMTIFEVLKIRKWSGARAGMREAETAVRRRFFLLFVYFVFVVAMGGFMFAPEESFIPNLLTILFRNQVFNFNLILFIATQAFLLWQEIYRNQGAPQNVKGETMDLRSGVIHAGILLGALLSYLFQKYGLPKAEHAFMFGFIAVKTLLEIWSALKSKTD